MPFYPPSWVPKLPFDIPDTVAIPDFIFDDKWGRHPLHHSRNFFTCGLSGKTYTPDEIKSRVDLLARAMAKEFGWHPNKGSEWDKVVGVFSFNTIDTITHAWATHKLGGISTPANAAYSAYELEHQMRDSGAKCIFTCVPLLDTTLQVAEKLGIPKNRIYLYELPKEMDGAKPEPEGYKTVSQLIEEGKNAPEIEPLKWEKGQGARQIAFLCYSSGTSGLPKGVMITHRNVIANTVQIATFDGVSRANWKDPKSEYDYQQNVLGLLPLSHIYGLVLIAHSSVYQGDGCIILPRFEFTSMLAAIQAYKISGLFLVPPIIILMTKNKDLLKKYDLNCVNTIFTGAAPLGKETADDLQNIFPHWKIRQGYGLTETCTVVCSSNVDDIYFGSSGTLLPGYEARIMGPDGEEITEYGKPGELWAKSPSVVPGYLNNQKATDETFWNGFMKTGDEVMIQKNHNGNEHLFIVDRIKELIKVKGLQVAPAELEAHLLTHPAVNDCTVISIPDDDAGERPKAFIVKSANAGGLEDNDKSIARDIQKHVESHKSRHKWLKEVEFVDEIPKSPSGKILRRLLRDREKEKKKNKGSKL